MNRLIARIGRLAQLHRVVTRTEPASVGSGIGDAVVADRAGNRH